MAAKWCVAFLVTVLVVAVLHSCAAAPHPNHAELLEKSLAEYLSHDKDLLHDLKELGFDEKAAPARAKRQSDLDNNDAELLGEEGKPGFFDKAAKFVMELLQKFLRWINTDDS
ncbi:uncharacterized protein [Euwallacea similis]|uniref:uncharacterized protein n=1 Tax=Euwallacea similis TaxID=1736056 RepID=UPI00344FE207